MASSRRRSATIQEKRPYTPRVARMAARAPKKRSTANISIRGSAVRARKRCSQVCASVKGMPGATARRVSTQRRHRRRSVRRFDGQEHRAEGELPGIEEDGGLVGLPSGHVLHVRDDPDDLEASARQVAAERANLRHARGQDRRGGLTRRPGSAARQLVDHDHRRRRRGVARRKGTPGDEARADRLEIALRDAEVLGLRASFSRAGGCPSMPKEPRHPASRGRTFDAPACGPRLLAQALEDRIVVARRCSPIGVGRPESWTLAVMTAGFPTPVGTSVICWTRGQEDRRGELRQRDLTRDEGMVQRAAGAGDGAVARLEVRGQGSPDGGQRGHQSEHERRHHGRGEDEAEHAPVDRGLGQARNRHRHAVHHGRAAKAGEQADGGTRERSTGSRRAAAPSCRRAAPRRRVPPSRARARGRG